MRDFARGVRDTLAAATPGALGPRDVAEVESAYLRDSDGSHASLVREMRRTGSRYRFHFTDKHNLHRVTVWGTAAQYAAYIAALERATEEVRKLNGVPIDSDGCVRLGSP
jgi:hypothetical protein